AGAEEGGEGFAVAAGAHGLEVARAVGLVEFPVLFELPGEEAEDAGDAPDDGGGVGEGGGLVDAEGDEDAAQVRDEREEQLVRDGDNGEMLDRVDLRFDQEVDGEAGDVGDVEPEDAQE